MKERWVFLSPSYVDDDEFIIKFASENRPHCRIVTNDNLFDHLERLRADPANATKAKWLKSALVKYMFVGDTFLTVDGFF